MWRYFGGDPRELLDLEDPLDLAVIQLAVDQADVAAKRYHHNLGIEVGNAVAKAFSGGKKKG